LNLPADATVVLRRYPEPLPPWEQLLQLFDAPWIEAMRVAYTWWRGLRAPGVVEVILPSLR
jgi:hypothetical protein